MFSLLHNLPFLKKACLATIAAILLSIVLLITNQFIEHFPDKTQSYSVEEKIYGGDFLAFYIGGKLFSTHRDKLYDLEFQREYRAELLGDEKKHLSGELPFVYPPLVAYICSLFAEIPYRTAYLIWMLLGMVLSFSSLLFLASELEVKMPYQLLLFPLLAFGYVPYYLNTLLGGQLSWLGICVLSTVTVALLRNKFFIAGLLLSLGYYKPPLFLFASLYLALRSPLRFLLGAATGGVVLSILSLYAVGVSGLVSYLEVISHYTYGQPLIDSIELPPAAGMGIYALLTTYLSSLGIHQILLVALYLAGLALVSKQRDKQTTPLELAFVLTCTVALSVQCIKYDLALLLVPFLLLYRSLNLISLLSRTVLLGCIVVFYFEFLGRKIQLAGSIINISSLLFLALLLTLFTALMNQTTNRTDTIE